MENTMLKTDFVPRVNLRRTLKYRPHLKWAYYFALCSAVELLIFSIFLAVRLDITTSVSNWLNGLIAATIVSTLLFLVAVFFFKPFAFLVVQVSSDHLEIDQRGKKVQIPYDQVAELKFSHIPCTGGWFKIVLKDKSHYIFTTVLERSEYILESIAAYNSKLVDKEKLESYRRTAIVCDHSFGYFYSSIYDRSALLLKFIAIPVLITFITALVVGFKNQTLFSDDVIFISLTLCLVQFLISFVGWWVTTIILSIKTRSNLIERPNFTLRNMDYEKQMNKTSQKIQILCISLIVSGVLISFIAK